MNTLAVSAYARWYAEIVTHADLLRAVHYSLKHRLPRLLLGEGSNVILPPEWPGLVIRLRTQGIELLSQNQHSVRVEVQAGESWHQFVHHACLQGWYGLENLAYIPGTVGAAPVQNIGAYAVELSQFLESVTVLDIQSMQHKRLSKEVLGLGYRKSFFQTQWRDRYIIQSVIFRLQSIFQPNLDYDIVRQETERLKLHSALELFQLICRLRQERLPEPSQAPNAGSFFKNPVIPFDQFYTLKQRYSAIKGYEQQGQQVKISAAWLIQQLGYAGQLVGCLRIPEKNSLAFINEGAGDGKAVLDAAQQIQNNVWQSFHIQLEIEPVHQY